jgi:GDPmannose 4,6-dehydratase
MKIIAAVREIIRGERRELRLGNLDIWRDWGWAPEYVEAMYGMLQAETPDDYVIASGKSHSLREFVNAAFEHAGLDPQGRLEVNSGLMRPTDLSYSAMDPGKIQTALGWKAKLKLEAVVARMMDSLIP